MPAVDGPPRPVHERRLMLAPGVRATRRDDGHVQVGLEAGARVVAVDEPEVRRLLSALRYGERVDLLRRPAQRCLEQLVDLGLVVDADEYFTDLPGDPGLAAAVAAAYAHHGLQAHDVVAARARSHVTVEGPPQWRALASDLLRRSGLGGRCGAAVPPAASLVMSATEIPRARSDLLVRDGVPHLFLAANRGRLHVGPFVVPGLTACLRCVDAHLAEPDPRRALVVEQYATAGEDDLRPEPCDPALLSIAIGLAVRDLVTLVDRRKPLTWSASVLVGPDLDLAPRLWLRHPCCGCAWGDLLWMP